MNSVLNTMLDHTAVSMTLQVCSVALFLLQITSY